MMITRACNVLFDSIPVGYLAYLDDSGFATFEYTEEWQSEGFSLSPIYLPLSNQTFTFSALAFETYKGLPAVFADSLPDDFGNSLINAWLARSGQDKSQFLALDRLLYTGSRGMGALEYQPTNNNQEVDSQPILIGELVTMAQKVLDSRDKLQLNDYEESSMAKLLQIGTSAGGARAKAVVAVNADRSEIRSGQVDAPDGFEHYLLKFDGVQEHKSDKETFGDPKGYGVMEYVYYLMARDAGIVMSECELLRERNSDRAHFMTRRFDRVNNQKYHVLSLCGIAHADFRKPGAFSYEELLAVCRQLGLSNKEQEQIYRRMVFNVVARNHDDHTKNWSFMVNDEYKWTLAPAFDVAWSYKADSPWVNAHQLTLAGKRDNFQINDLLSVATQITSLRPSKAKNIINETIKIVSGWREYAEDEGVPKTLIDSVWESLRINW
ncbi:type II toxin-antitoxin system HipA family toxin [Dickeya solani]|nr:type II toxin-antitoxin system HipA family toxin [Dickeya solani]MCZ0785716.1 type II toxin-antitoxin system HipA family toxin [Dickeya solani]MCZ0797395.1 type II toxin-antitoxin system HipA family toxin [Dickeya solani]MDV7008359.1 type II toxin-antitoxin system HipA family toxin [Dickeya solani]WBV96663.1 type II toxin-antitoxin system HipA family toxin [Dickeya solani]WBW00787.1 type II toxin-antitoxin system HipA family toxin [Dickeya solani]